MSLRDRIESSITVVQGTTYRVVESQEEIATTELVANIQEQMRLEELLEQSKPPRPEGTEGLHYLLATPFRYPPLKYGSRFGRPFEKSLFYGAMTVNTTLAEAAFYRFVFISDMVVPYPKPLKTLHTLFATRVRTSRGVRLQDKTWEDLHDALTNPASYDACQNLGTTMRESGIEGFQFLSARARQAGLYELPYSPAKGLEGVNAALFSPRALKDRKPRSRYRLIMMADPTTVTMSLTNEEGRKTASAFSRDTFLVDGRLPCPAS
ncbi:RES domain-containing protein [Marinobacter sp. NP-4(2019)]|uniref:RES family NAD+ phosphorylase n=1 Tax=Marinobacter sp. NP-4(2019) TaxID=2488665 RepID=UPI000FC3DBDD|nr:RES family NAD+ phosphorylase [Marinobacter sp. NP-4(2019)]AZT83779.1 RES domain-containing protein [Marinobacter sp. NP-4(2019)]